MKKTARIFLLLLLCLSVSGCRTRTGMNETAGSDFSEDQTGIRPGLFSGFLPDDRTGPEEQEKNGETGGQTKENPDASRKEYDETRPAEVMQGATQSVHGSGEGDGYSVPGEAEDPAAAKLNEEAEQAATRTVAAEEAEQKGISGDAEEADWAASCWRIYAKPVRKRRSPLWEQTVLRQRI